MNIDKIVAAIPGQPPEERRRTRTNAVQMLATGTEAQIGAAGQLIAALDEQDGAETATLRDRLAVLPVAQRVAEAFKAGPMTGNERKTIQALFDNPGATSTELSRACGQDNMIWQMHFGNLCKDRQAYLWPAAKAEKREGLFFSGILADIDPTTNRFTMKPGVAVAFAALGLKAQQK